MQRQIKNSYEILSPSFLKFTGVCVSLYLCAISIKLFILSPRYTSWPVNIINNNISPWIIISGVFILFVSFAGFTFMKINNSRIYLWNMYILCFMKCFMFLYILHSRARTLSDANMLMRIVLCLGFLFMFSEFLYMQTSMNFVRDKCVLSAIMGITSCLTHIVITFSMILNGFVWGVCIFIFYIFYALRILILSLLKKEAKTSMVFECLFIVFLLLLALTSSPIVTGMVHDYTLQYVVTMEILIIFCCIRWIPRKNDFVSPLHKTGLYILRKLYCIAGKVDKAPQSDVFFKISGILMLTVRFTYFRFLAFNMINIWREDLWSKYF